MSDPNDTPAMEFRRKAADAWRQLEATGDERYLEDALRYERAAKRFAEAAAPRSAACRCSFNRREFFAAAREAGLDTSAKDAARAAVGMFLGRRIVSRSELSGDEWALCAGAIRAGRLFW